MEIFTEQFRQWIIENLPPGTYALKCVVKKSDEAVTFSDGEFQTGLTLPVAIVPDEFKKIQDWFKSKPDPR